jgi:hypothetical protein
MQDTYVVSGTLSDERTVKLDQPVPFPSPRVRVTLEPLHSQFARPYAEVMAEIRQRQRARGHRPPTREEVDGYVLSERQSWNE